MKRTRLIAVLVAVFAVGIFATDASAFYHPGMGRWMQRDPGAGGMTGAPRVGTAGPAVGGQFIPTDPTGQYRDGPNLYGCVGNNPVNWVDWTGNAKEKPGKGGGTSPGTPAPGTPGSVGPPEPPAGEGATCGIQVYRSAICTLSPKKPSDFGHEWITDGTTTWDFPKNYFQDPVQPCHKYDKEHPMHIWNAHVTYWGGGLPNGTPCKQASCRQIKACLQDAENEWAGTPYTFWGHNCIGFAQFALKKCCMAKGVFETRSPGWGEETKVCCEREKEMDRLGCNGGGGP